tara:strand:- start:2241 stop:2741 length:501 start_codon:yes stop_codon:yes gene_type:complete
MLGLGSSLTQGSYANNAISFQVAPVFFLAQTDTADSGDVILSSAASTTSFDIRIQINVSDYDESADSPSDFTLTDLSITNNTTGVSQTIASSVTMDNFVDFAGANLLYFFTDAGGPADDLDFSSDSGEAAAHNGSGTNDYTITAELSRDGFSGSVTVTKTVQLANG